MDSASNGPNPIFGCSSQVRDPWYSVGRRCRVLQGHNSELFIRAGWCVIRRFGAKVLGTSLMQTSVETSAYRSGKFVLPSTFCRTALRHLLYPPDILAFESIFPSSCELCLSELYPTILLPSCFPVGHVLWLWGFKLTQC